MTHRFPIRVYYEDTDAGGIVYHANYLKFAERGRTEWLRDCGIDQSALRVSQSILFVVANASIDYHAPALLDDALAVETDLTKLGNASITLEQKVIRKDDSANLADIKVVVVCVNEKRKPCRIPDSVRQALQ